MMRLMLVLVGSLAVFLLRCAPLPVEEAKDAGNTSPKATETGPQAVMLQAQEGTKVRYLLRWSWEGASWDDEQKAYLFQSDAGYRFGISSGYVGTAALQCVPSETSRRAASRGWAWRWLPRLAIAHADHTISTDTSVVSAPVAESIFAKDALFFGESTLRDVRYNQLHLLMATPNETASDGYLLQRWSFLLKGWYQKPATEEKVSFQASVSLPAGAMVPLLSADAQLTGATQETLPSGSVVEVDVERSVVRALAALRPDEISETDLAYKTLLRLGQTSSVTLTVR
ncbi:MAG: hypothetical protein H6728_15050 [Myxococcales bacterium]|nr:hypothetical protein [Myxococcales bacterium]